jgi:phosphoglycerate dehydrogenase-like enzyme
VDEEALIECLRSGHLAAAGLDVFAAEPLDAGSPLWSLPNVFITPHLGSYTQRQWHFAAEVLIENLTRFFSGRPLINLVDFKLGY